MASSKPRVHRHAARDSRGVRLALPSGRPGHLLIRGPWVTIVSLQGDPEVRIGRKIGRGGEGTIEGRAIRPERPRTHATAVADEPQLVEVAGIGWRHPG